jgi:hypothetical protein
VRRLVVALAGVMLVSVLGPVPAQAEGPAVTTPPTVTAKARQLGEPAVRSALKAGAKGDDLASQARKRALASTSGGGYDGNAAAAAPKGKLQANAASVPSEPDPGFAAECEASKAAANDPFGYVKNRFQWCTTNLVTAVAANPEDPAEDGYLLMTFVLVGYGRDDGSRNVRIFMRPMSVIALGSLGLQTSVKIDLDCLHDTPGCSTGPGYSATLAEWLARSVSGAWVPLDLYSDETVSTDLLDKVLYHVFATKLTIRGTTTVWVADDNNQPLSYFIRCDSATYFSGRPKACIFHDVLPHLQYALTDADGSNSAVHGVAQHIQEAFTYPNATYPLKIDGDKNIPGNYDRHTDTDYLERVPYDGPDWRANGAVKDAACQRRGDYIDTGLPTPPGDGEQCDEYPFATTVQGAAHPYWDFSVKAVPTTENGAAGLALQAYYRDDRILYYDGDLFYVQILATAGGGGGGPTVSAGPDVHGYEGRPLQMRGAGAGDLVWSVAGDPGNDPGANCEFSDTHIARPTVTCNDDGTFTATLTSSNGASDSATISVLNAAPEVTIASPKPWQVVRAGTEVALSAPFTDAANDTHTCEVLWDDGTTGTFAPTVRSCETTHVFAHAGMYTIKVAVTDDDGATGEAEVLLIAYDPNGGWANIDGSTPTEGSLLSQSGATGSTWEHAAAKYYSTSNPPTGTMKAWVENTSFRLDPTALQWLVVTPDNKVAIKGTGSVAGEPGWGFLLYGFDSPDSAGLVVWKDDGTGIPHTGFIYNSVSGGSFDVDRITGKALTSGQVLVQR